jgi:hypothetical protein
MLRIDEPNNVGNRFVISAPGVPPTRFGSKWPNVVQEELVAVALAKPGAVLDQTGATTGQVLDAINFLIEESSNTAQDNAETASLAKSANLSDLTNLAAAWTHLGVGITTNSYGSYIQIGPLMVMWGSAIGNSTTPHNLPASFSDYTKAQIITGNSDAQGANNDVVYAYLLTDSTYYFGSKQTNGGNAESGYPGSWIAIGPA